MNNVLRLGKSGYPDSADPAVSNSRQAWTISNTAYQRLFRYKQGSNKTSDDVEGDLAANWSLNSSLNRLKILLKPNQYFIDGSLIDSKAVVFSIRRAQKINKAPAIDLRLIDSIYAIDQMTVEVKLAYPFSLILEALTGNGASIVSPKVLEYQENNDLGQAYLKSHTLGSGAYQIEASTDHNIYMAVNPYYPESLFYDALDIQIIPQAKKRIEDLENHKLDIVEDLSPDDIQSLRVQQNVRIVDKYSHLITSVFFNTRKPILRDVRVRQALTKVIDQKRIIQDIFKHQARILKTLDPDFLNDNTAGSQYTQPDIKAARALFKELKINRLELVYLSDYPGRESYWNRIAECLQEDFQQLNVSLEIKKVTFEKMKQRIPKGEFDISVGDWIPSYNDPWAAMKSMYHPERSGLRGNQASYQDEIVIRLLKTIDSSVDMEERKQLYLTLEQQAADDCPYLLMVQRKYMCAMRTDLKGYHFHPFDWQLWDFTALHKKTEPSL